MAKNVFRFRRLKWGDPEKPWLKRGSPLPPAGGSLPPGPQGAERRWLDSPWLVLAGAVLAFGLGLLLFSGS